jgi:hypothetical protein
MIRLSLLVGQALITVYIDRCVDTRLFQSASPGDTVSFKFHPKNHTVTQSSFEAPCTPLYGGIDTGLCVSSIQISHTTCFLMSSYRIVCLLHWVLMTTTSPPGNSLLQTYVFPSNTVSPPRDGTNCPF